ncbi:hypothetical protein BSKO_03925 [Bryopsis sp. KO-2023]|nr:hypothetical protein BSKO_03925 [Bryopsis sp. KO-2023]
MGDSMEVDDFQPVTQEASQPAERKTAVAEELMRTYYSALFPVDEFYKWLAYGNDAKHPQAASGYFQRREFCFTLPQDIFVRYQSFKDGGELHKALVNRCPAKIDIGPVYNIDPQRRNAYSGGQSRFGPEERELVFDIDLTDYDDVRTCCQEGNVCEKDWAYMSAAIKILDEGLREDFGFEHILWVFSGRRGIHCWVCDQRARSMSDKERSAVASYFTAYKGQEKGFAKFTNANCKHPAMERALMTCDKIWRKNVLPQQRIFENEQTAKKIYDRIPDGEVVRRAQNSKAKNIEEPNRRMWHALSEEINRQTGSRGGDRKLQWELTKAKEEIILANVYPRLDVEVSKKMNHLLKAPFCIHPKTGNVCVPIDPKSVEEFDPTTVPTLQQVVEEYFAAGARAKDENSKGWEHTAMAPYIDTFNRCFLDRMKIANNAALGQKARATSDRLSW